MSKDKVLVLFTLLLIKTVPVSAQELHSIESSKKVIQESNAHLTHDYKGEGVFGNLFLFYKKFISSQDNSKCTFQPSCSEYMKRSVNEQGMIGFMNGMDRLSRCNGCNTSLYSIDSTTNLLIDSVNQDPFIKNGGK